MERMLLVLLRQSDQESALRQLLDDQQVIRLDPAHLDRALRRWNEAYARGG